MDIPVYLWRTVPMMFRASGRRPPAEDDTQADPHQDAAVNEDQDGIVRGRRQLEQPVEEIDEHDVTTMPARLLTDILPAHRLEAEQKMGTLKIMVRTPTGRPAK